MGNISFCGKDGPGLNLKTHFQLVPSLGTRETIPALSIGVHVHLGVFHFKSIRFFMYFKNNH